MNQLPVFRVGLFLLVISGCTPAAAITPNQRNAATHFQRGLQLSLDNKWSAAEAEYRSAIQLDPNNPKYRSYLADALAAQGKFQKAQQSSQQQKQLIKQGYKPTPIEKTKTARKIVPSKTGTRVVNNNTLRGTDDSQMVIPPRLEESSMDNQVTRGTGAGNPGAGEDTTNSQSKSQPGLPPIALPSYMTGEDEAKSGGKVSGSSTIRPNVTQQDVGDGGNGEGREILDKALALYEEEKWAAAEAEYRKATRAHPKMEEGWDGLGDACFQQKKWAEAEKSYRQASRLNPEEGYYHAQIAHVLLKVNRRDEAMKEAQQAKHMGVEDHEAFDELGLTVTQEGH